MVDKISCSLFTAFQMHTKKQIFLLTFLFIYCIFCAIVVVLTFCSPFLQPLSIHIHPWNGYLEFSQLCCLSIKIKCVFTILFFCTIMVMQISFLLPFCIPVKKYIQYIYSLFLCCTQLLICIFLGLGNSYCLASPILGVFHKKDHTNLLLVFELLIMHCGPLFYFIYMYVI